MGDSSINTKDEPKLTSTETSPPPNANTSIEILRESKPSENISINSPPTTTSVPSVSASSPRLKEKNSKIETVFEKIDINDKSDSNSDSTTGGEMEKDSPVKPDGGEVPTLDFDIKETKPVRNKSDIFALDAKSKHSNNTIFSIKGTPSGRINRRRDNNSNVFPAGIMGCKEFIPGDDMSSPRKFLDAKQAAEDQAGHIDNTPRKRPSSAHMEKGRNPLTGEGVSSNDEIKKTHSGRRRGKILISLRRDNVQKCMYYP